MAPWVKLLLVLFVGQGMATGVQAETGAAAGQWRSLFNGRDLTGWIPKINHRPVGDNYRNTFVAEDGVLRISHAAYDRYFDQFAHLTYATPFSNYRLRLDYRFVGQDAPGGPPWSKRNSGVMIHGQAADTIGLDQPFPVSIEIQLLNGTAEAPRTTGNVCSPGTNFEKDSVLITKHCITSASRPYSGDGWVHLEIEVRGGRSISTFVDGVEVIKVQKPQIDPVDLRAMGIYLKNGAKELLLDRGYISLQGEGHPIEFRNIEIMELPE